MGNGVRAAAAAVDRDGDLSADAPHQVMARHGAAAAMRTRIAGPSITNSSNKAWRTGGDDVRPGAALTLVRLE